MNIVAAAFAAMLVVAPLGSGDRLVPAKTAVTKIVEHRIIAPYFSDVQEKPQAVCGKVHVRNRDGTSGWRLFVYVYDTQQGHVIDLPELPQQATAALEAYEEHCMLPSKLRRMLEFLERIGLYQRS